MRPISEPDGSSLMQSVVSNSRSKWAMRQFGTVYEIARREWPSDAKARERYVAQHRERIFSVMEGDGEMPDRIEIEPVESGAHRAAEVRPVPETDGLDNPGLLPDGTLGGVLLP